MRPNPLQQALVGIGVLLVVTATLVTGVFLATNESSGQQIASPPTATAYLIPTLQIGPSATAQAAPSSTPRPAPTRATVQTTPPGTAGLQASATDSLLPATASATPQACTIPSHWQPYQVRRGDTVFSIGLLYGLSVNSLLSGNCRSSSSLESGEWIYVPPVTPRPQASQPPMLLPVTTFPPDDHATQTASDGSCLNPNSAITAPPVGARLSGEAVFYGTARKGDFSFYKLEIRQEGYSSAADFMTFYTGVTEVINGQLGTLLTPAFRNGEYWIRLTVVDSTGNYLERCSRLYVIHN